jgi:hypothetical protein
MEEGYTQLGTVLIDQRLADSEEDGVIVVAASRATATTAFSSAKDGDDRRRAPKPLREPGPM